MLLAQVATMTIAHWVALIIIVAGLVAIMYVVLNKLGVQVPPFIVTIFWIVVAVIVGLIAIRLIMDLMV